ncbi:anthranilate phosphoribosyltransferase [Hyphobacterium sp.]|uniref:anthranilate phosphoribosyltransferase n=1 Tax=Hyphobacterium sp. TaxID=2004662 RepID=UPI003B52061D
MSALHNCLQALSKGQHPGADDIRAAFDLLMEGEAGEAEIGGFLIGLAAVGETPEDLAIGAQSLRKRMKGITAPEGAIDTCGTGGDAKGTYNISTAAAIVAAGAGAKVAKHGNRAASSKSGSAEVLAALGMSLEATPDQVTRAVNEAGVGFLFAPAHHSAVRHVGGARKALRSRTIFNLLGPLANPGGAKRQLLGVFDARWQVPVAEALDALGCDFAWVVHGSDGLDEITTTGETRIVQLDGGDITEFTLSPEAAGIATASIHDLVGGTPEENAEAMRAVLDGAPGPYRDIVLVNAGAALIVAGLASDIVDGVRQAARAIDTGAAKAALDRMAAISRGET